MTTRTLFLLISGAALLPAQQIQPTVPIASVAPGKPFTLTIGFTSAGTPVAGIAWNLTLPPGAVVVWTAGAETTSAGKALYCGTPGTTNIDETQSCLAVGLDVTAISTGVLATGIVTLPVKARGTQLVTVTSSGADATGLPVAVLGGSVTLTAIASPFDLLGNGLSTQALQLADLIAAVGQVDGTVPCTTANWLNDGCTIADLMFLVADLQSASP